MQPPWSIATSTITDYVNATGIAPADGVRRLLGQGFDGAPASRVAAARALGNCLRIDPGLAGSGPPEIRDAVMRTGAPPACRPPPGQGHVPGGLGLIR